ncbi:MAG: polyphenol oxidase family protein [Solirubrobacteraceae bacterium]|nr:polyphenol oxidase family protein [Solirubrobacteraceae bacterium]
MPVPRTTPSDALVDTADGLRIDIGGASVWFTNRAGGASDGPYASLNLGTWTDDDPAAVRANRRRVAATVGVDPDRIAQAHQVHGVDVLTVHDDGDLPGADLERVRDGDGVATAMRGVPCVVLCADCLPVALVADGAVAMVHAGWRGLVGGVLEAGVVALRDVGGRGPITAIVGPGAGPCCYEVGPEVHAALAPLGRTVRRGDHADLPEAATLRLRAAGVDDVRRAGACTICDPAWFSHRRDGGITGRQGGVAWLR